MKHDRRTIVAFRITVVVVLELGLMWGLWKAVTRQSRAVDQLVGTISDLKDPSPFRVALLGHLGKIHLGLQGFLRSSDPSLEKQEADSVKDFEAALPEFQRQNPKLFPSAAADEIRRTFTLFNESADRTIDANAKYMERRNTLNQNFSRMLFLIDHNLQPLLRKAQAEGDERGEEILNIENQLRAWQQNLAQAWAQSSPAAQELTFENENRGETYLELYGRAAQLSKERKVVKEMRGLWMANNGLARESFAMQNVVNESVKAMDAEREQVVATLNRLLPAMPPSQLEARKREIMGSIRWRLAAASGLGLLALLSMIGAALLVYRLTRPEPERGPDGMFHAPAGAPVEPMMQMDLKGTLIAWSHMAESLYGYSAKEMVGQSIAKLFISESEIGRLSKELQSSRQATFETTHRTKNSGPIRVLIEFRPMDGGNGHSSAIGLICTRQ